VTAAAREVMLAHDEFSRANTEAMKKAALENLRQKLERLATAAERNGVRLDPSFTLMLNNAQADVDNFFCLTPDDKQTINNIQQTIDNLRERIKGLG
jgi:uncharacterized protein YicC (UPF0701 family)